MLGYQQHRILVADNLVGPCYTHNRIVHKQLYRIFLLTQPGGIGDRYNVQPFYIFGDGLGGVATVPAVVNRIGMACIEGHFVVGTNPFIRTQVYYRKWFLVNGYRIVELTSIAIGYAHNQC